MHNSFPINQRNDVGKLMATEVYRYLSNGGLLSSYSTKEVISGKIADKDTPNIIIPETIPK